MASKKIPQPKKPRAKPISKVKKKIAPMMGATTLTMAQVKEAIALLKNAGTFNTFSYKTPDFELEIELRKDSGANASSSILTAAPTPSKQGIAATQSSNSEASSKPARSQNAYEILSPMVGTFYRRPNPDSPPFVEVGDNVDKNTPVCIVEVMKLLNTIAAARQGRVAEICVADGATIEAGQTLMVLELV